MKRNGKEPSTKSISHAFRYQIIAGYVECFNGKSDIYDDNFVIDIIKIPIAITRNSSVIAG